MAQCIKYLKVKKMEIFKDIPDYENLYQVSNLGNVKSLKRFCKGNYNCLRLVNERILRNKLSKKDGYNRVCLLKNGKEKTFLAHRLVAMAFLNHIPNYYEKVINHKNFIRNDNRLDNLEIVSMRDNTSYRQVLGSSKYTGVYLCKNKNKFRAEIYIGKSKIYLCNLKNEKHAKLVYEEALKNIHLFDGNKFKFRKIIKDKMKEQGIIMSLDRNYHNKLKSEIELSQSDLEEVEELLKNNK